MYEKVLLYAMPAFIGLMLLEMAVAAARGVARYRLADALTSVGLGALSTYSGVFTRLVSFGVYVLVYRGARLATLDAGDWRVWLGALIAYDFLYYWYHRLGHEVNVLWAAHVVHHQSEEYNLSTALRQTSSGFLLGWVFYLPLALAGVPPEVFLGVGLIDLLYQFWIHTEQIGSLGAFDRIFASPSNHRVHHAVNERYLDRNYGGILILWDRLFGTFQPELPAERCVYGTRDPLRSWNPLWANLHTYAVLWRDCVGTRRWGDKLKVFWARPGWRPADVAARAPKAAFALPLAKYAPPLPALLGGYCLAQFVVVLALGARFLALEPGLSRAAALAWLAALTASLWIIGGLAEGRRGYVALEALRLLAGLAAGLVMAPAPPLAAVAVVLLGAWLWRAARALPPVAVA
ncbi:MAG: sterol desaturase family protein [Proteobacteria bacterium]|nr:sterol desaturase family protein [Pseudomonadota bacterium]